MSCFVSFPLRPFQISQGRREESAAEVRSRHLFVLNEHQRLLSSGLSVMTCNHRSCSPSLSLQRSCSSATSHCATPQLLAPSEAFPAVFCFFHCWWILLNRFACRLSSCQPVWLKVYKTCGAFRCAVALSGSGYYLHCRVYAHSDTLFTLLPSFGLI